MARKIRTADGENEQLDPYTSGTPVSRAEFIDDSAQLVNQSPMMPSAVARDASLAEVAPSTKFLVERNALVMNRGCRVLLRAGKVIDAGNYDLEALRSQGVVLVEQR